MKRAVILGRGGSGKSTLAVKLGEITGLPVFELDKVFWQRLEAMPRAEWVKTQQRLVEQENWIMDGDLGHYDAVEGRLRVADTIILLDFSLVRCAWRALRRGRERSFAPLMRTLTKEPADNYVSSKKAEESLHEPTSNTIRAPKQIKGIKERHGAAEQKITELRLAVGIEADDLAIEHAETTL
ncbi:MAG TPA: hypothetical protein VEK33_12020 [Terriglobales bacterium]|nr:hypothetical protein [Terriglobales bacterium]